MHLVDVYLIDEDKQIKAEIGVVPGVVAGQFVVVGGVATYVIVAVSDTEVMSRRQRKSYGPSDRYLVGKVL